MEYKSSCSFYFFLFQFPVARPKSSLFFYLSLPILLPSSFRLQVTHFQGKKGKTDTVPVYDKCESQIKKITMPILSSYRLFKALFRTSFLLFFLKEIFQYISKGIFRWKSFRQMFLFFFKFKVIC